MFTIAGQQFAIRRVSMWKDGFQLFAGDQSVCEVKRGFWSRRFELSAIDEKWLLQPAGWFTRNYQLLRGDWVVGLDPPGRLVHAENELPTLPTPCRRRYRCWPSSWCWSSASGNKSTQPTSGG